MNVSNMTSEQLAEKEYPYHTREDIDDITTWPDGIEIQRSAYEKGYEKCMDILAERDIDYTMEYIQNSAGNLSKWLLSEMMYYIHDNKNIPGVRMTLYEGIKSWVEKERKNNQ